MTDDDHALLIALRDACDTFCLSLAGTRLSHEDHIEMALLFLDMADRMLKQLIDTPTTAEDTTT
ncbi:MAG TPA: hypothetical protein VFQ77_16585 [Pseudonocardiaceae bacterium]|jgi:hypothetical protein|nr:hypothetical protein [Pseudonocardiaceae bacterium]